MFFYKKTTKKMRCASFSELCTSQLLCLHSLCLFCYSMFLLWKIAIFLFDSEHHSEQSRNEFRVFDKYHLHAVTSGYMICSQIPARLPPPPAPIWWATPTRPKVPVRKTPTSEPCFFCISSYHPLSVYAPAEKVTLIPDRKQTKDLFGISVILAKRDFFRLL